MFNLKQEFLGFIETIKEAGRTVGETPMYKTFLAIATHPEAYYPNPEEIAANIKIEVCPEFVNDPELFQPTVDAYVKALSQIYDQLKRDLPRPGAADAAFRVMAAQISIKYQV